MSKPKWSVGAWLRWQRSAGLVIGVVQYVKERSDHYPWDVEYTTDVGTVEERFVLEARVCATPTPSEGGKSA